MHRVGLAEYVGMDCAVDMMIKGARHSSQFGKPGELTRQQLATYLAAGTVVRVAPRWYVTSEIPADVRRALTAGCRLTCVSAAAYYGLWTPPVPGVHVAALRGACSENCDLVLHPHPHMRTWPCNDPILPLDAVLEHASYCLPVPYAAALFESAVNLGLLTMFEAQAIIGRLPRARARQLRRIREDIGSGTETVVRWWLESRGVRVKTQVKIPGVGRVDILVGERWIIECDSGAHHSSAEDMERDRRRDREAQRLGYVVTRLTWRQVFLEWEVTSAFLTGELSRRFHRSAPKPA